MASKKDLIQQIAVFGESGSGKTVLLSSFYGRSRELQQQKESGFEVIASDSKQDKRLYAEYVRMRDDAEAPERTRQAMTSYPFDLYLQPDGKPTGLKPTLRVVWHDYPGEWFETDDLSGPTELERRVEAFRALLGADVALLMIDGQKLLDNAGNERGYLKAVLHSYQTTFARLKSDVLADGAKRIRFPRIWLFALSKADLHPEMTVEGFRDRMLKHVDSEMEHLEDVLAGFVAGRAAFTIGQEFVLLSSAEFRPDRIDVSTTKGVDLMLPIAAALPLEWHAKWGSIAKLPHGVVDPLLESLHVLDIAPFVVKFVDKLPLPPPVKALAKSAKLLEAATALLLLGGDALRTRYRIAIDNHDFRLAALLRLREELEQGEKAHVLLRRTK